MKRFDPIMEVNDDGYFIPEARQWTIEKYKLVGGYCDIFTKGMKTQWDQLVYIDLFTGAGYTKIVETGQILKSSALIALSVPVPFTKYILCEHEPKRFEALKYRIEKNYSNHNVELIFGDSNKNIDLIRSAIPRFGKGNTLLPFCFVDPFSLNLRFSTIQALGSNLMDFLILQALHMDANRNFNHYINEKNDKIAEYLGKPEWRDEFLANENLNRKDFVRFLAEQYQMQMVNLGYRPDIEMHPIKSNVKNLPLYYLAFYSKHPRGNEFFKKVKKYCNPQLDLNL